MSPRIGEWVVALPWDQLNHFAVEKFSVGNIYLSISFNFIFTSQNGLTTLIHPAEQALTESKLVQSPITCFLVSWKEFHQSYGKRVPSPPQSDSLFNTTVFCVPKKGGNCLRIVQDFHELYLKSYIDKYTMKDIHAFALVTSANLNQ